MFVGIYSVGVVPYLSRPFLFTEVNGKGQVHRSKYCICFTGLRVANKLPQALIHNWVEEGKVVPVYLRQKKEVNFLLNGIDITYENARVCKNVLTFLPSSTLMTCLFNVIGQSSF